MAILSGAKRELIYLRAQRLRDVHCEAVAFVRACVTQKACVVAAQIHAARVTRSCHAIA